MDKRIATTKPGWNIPVEVTDKFKDFCTRVGSRMQDDCSGALWLWMYMPPQVRELSKLAATGSIQADEDAWREFGRGIDCGCFRRLRNRPKKRSRSTS
jgi:hypothetical protein